MHPHRGGLGARQRLLSPCYDALDEIDFEFLGCDVGTVQLNRHKMGKRGREIVSKPGLDAFGGIDAHAIVWAPSGIGWYIDGYPAREAAGADLPRTLASLVPSLWNGTPAIANRLGSFDASRTSVAMEFD